MQEKVVSLIEAKNDSRLWSPRRALQEMIADIDAGKIDPTRLIVLAWEEDDKRRLTRKITYLSNMTNADFVAFTALAAKQAIEEWENGK